MDAHASRLAILPDLTHYEVGPAPILPTTVILFRDGKTHNTMTTIA